MNTFTSNFTGKNLIELDSVASTNSFASELLQQEQPPEGTVIIGYNQSQGRGQQGAVWESEAWKNLTFSIIYYPTFISPEDQFLLNQAVSVGIVEFIRKKIERKVFIKWPNDLFIGGKKIGGILIENVLRGDKILSSVIGIGLNINQIQFSKDVPNATSFKILTGRDFDLKDCLNSVCSSIEKNYIVMKNSTERENLRAKYNQHLYGINREISYLEGNKERKGTIMGTSLNGKLLVKDAENEIHIYSNKEMSFIF